MLDDRAPYDWADPLAADEADRRFRDRVMVALACAAIALVIVGVGVWRAVL